jgi:hypothetical protein
MIIRNNVVESVFSPPFQRCLQSLDCGFGGLPLSGTQISKKVQKYVELEMPLSTRLPKDALIRNKKLFYLH